MTTIKDIETKHSRLVVRYDRYGIEIHEWAENECEETDEPFCYQYGWFSWETIGKFLPNYDGKLNSRIAQSAIECLASYGGSSNDSGPVDDLNTVISCGIRKMFWR